MDDRIANVREHMQPKWDDLHEQRLLDQVLAEKQRRLARDKATTRIAAGAGLLAAAGLAFFMFRPGSTVEVAEHSGVPATPEQAVVQDSVLSLSDGSRAILRAGAVVQTTKESAESVVLAQKQGRVRYEVRPDRKREFVVLADDVRLRVIGTVFTVAIEAQQIGVKVERGQVEVRHADRVVQLTAGEHLSVNRAGKPLPAATPEPETVNSPAQPVTAPSADQTAATLMAKADKARKAGRLAEAAQALRLVASKYPRDSRAISALFTLGRVERAMGDPARAAATFRSVRTRAPSGPLAEDALAEEASSWQAAGNKNAAKKAAESYLNRYPSGPHATRVRGLVQ